MDVDIAGKLIHLAQPQVVGLGGEGTVFLATIGGQRMAVKIYHTPTSQRAEKLHAFLAQPWNLPSQKIALPLELVREAQQGNVIGLTMPFLAGGFAEIAYLANKKHRTAFRITTRQIVEVFLDGADALSAIHACGLVVGDLNDQNILYQQNMMLWIDVDAWQFAAYACPVGTEDFLAPELYGLDLSLQPVFKPEHDWYTFAVHLFRSLLLAHPYGGTHKEAHSLIQRAQQRLFVLHPGVTYPKMAYSPDMLSDDLAQVFERIFARGWRGTFPVDVLRQYASSLVACPTCQAYYPRSRRTCPLCQVSSIITLPQTLIQVGGVSVSELLHPGGKIVFARVQEETIVALAYEQGQTVLYSKHPVGVVKRKELFKEQAGARYDLLGNTLLVNLPGTAELMCIDIAQEQPVALLQTTTAMFAGMRKAMFQASDRYIFSIQHNALMASTIIDDTLSGRPLRAVTEKQTWFCASQTTTDGKPTVFGFFQVFRQQLYWLVRDHAVYDVTLALLNPGESLLDIVAYFSSQDVLIRRHTQEYGSDYLRTERIDYSGKVMQTTHIKRADHPCPQLHGLIYAAGMLLHPTDNGIVQERIGQQTFKTFSGTKDFVQGGDTLELYQAGLLIIGEDYIHSLVMH
jgi:serine/threonine protein kinase